MTENVFKNKTRNSNVVVSEIIFTHVKSESCAHNFFNLKRNLTKNYTYELTVANCCSENQNVYIFRLFSNIILLMFRFLLFM